MPLTRLLYFSENVLGCSSSTLAELQSILSASIRNNKAAGITGALVFDNDWFLQALEGERDKVWGTLRRIEEDDRHANLVIIEARPVESRLFGNWWMGLAARSCQTTTAFAPHLQDGLFQPQHMRPDAVLDLMTALCQTGLARKLASAAAAA